MTRGSLQTAPQRVKPPTIKGVFVNSHIQAVRRLLGEAGVAELSRRFGRPVSFANTDDVPIADEVAIIEHALDLTSAVAIPRSRRAYEAGRLHFRNFTTTPWAKVLFGLFPRNLKFMLLHAGTVAERVFKGVTFETHEMGPRSVQILMGNNDYPVEHFRGLFHEWMRYFGLKGEVSAGKTSDGRFEYIATWDGREHDGSA
ncbi:MAG: DUF2378 family protein [Euryarchaeota archaeon]|nr:DUF2378 family protein [Euryarchaeota archaeon]